jgi:hypothetical protein
LRAVALRPLNAYGYSKMLFDQYAARQSDRGQSPGQWAGLKFFNVYGPNEGHKGSMKSVVAQIWPKVAADETVTLFRSHNPNYVDGGQMRDFVFVDDVVDIIAWLLETPHVSGVFNAGSGQARSFLDLANATFAAAGKTPPSPMSIRRSRSATATSISPRPGWSGSAPPATRPVDAAGRGRAPLRSGLPVPAGSVSVKRQRLTFRQWVGWCGFAIVFLIAAATAVWRGDILKAGLDPQVPFQTYTPPPAPTTPCRKPGPCARRGRRGRARPRSSSSTPPPMTAAPDWNGPIDDRAADAYLRRVVIPNYAGPFERAGAISIPRYRQASLYTRLTLRMDARDARAFAYGDVAAAFETWLARHPSGPIVWRGWSRAPTCWTGWCARGSRPMRPCIAGWSPSI